MLEQVQAVAVGNFVAAQPIVHDVIGIDFEFAPAPVRLSYEQVEAIAIERLESIKSMHRRDIPQAIVELFQTYATREMLGDGFFDNEEMEEPVEGAIDRWFCHQVMKRVFRLLGTGSRSAAYALDDEWVIKMNCIDTCYDGADGGFDWALACIEMNGNKFTPVVSALYQKNHEYCMIVERLDENRDFTAPDVGCFLDLAESHHDEMDWAEYLLDVHEYPTFVLMAAMNRDHLLQLSKQYETVASGTKASEDLTDFNVMLRGRTPVINDPFADSNSGLLAFGKSYSWAMADA